MSIKDHLRDQELLEHMCHQEWLKGAECYEGIEAMFDEIDVNWFDAYDRTSRGSYRIPLGEFERMWKDYRALRDFDHRLDTRS